MTLENKYAKAVEQITLSDDAKSRILKNIAGTDLDTVKPVKTRKYVHWKPIAITVTACAALILVINIPRTGNTASSAPAYEEKAMLAENSDAAGEAEAESYNGTAVYNAESAEQYHYTSLQKLEEAAGYEIIEPALSFKPSSTTYELYNTQIYIIYQSDAETITLTASQNELADSEWTYVKETDDAVLEGYEEDQWLAVKYQINGIYYELTVSNPVDEKAILSMIPSHK